ncbi:MAG: hypothetical protein IIB12_08915 [Chloroflexi bacterium]|nr:hypothetical protein [Chloroflexota bacterium]
MRGNPMRRLWLVAVLGTIVAMVVAACGGGDATATPAPTVAPTATQAIAPTATAGPTPASAVTATPAPPEPKYGGIIQARFFPFPSWDTYNVRGGYSFTFTNNLLNNLFHLSLEDASVIVPDLATSWDVSDDGTVVTIRLAQGARWHDGMPFTSADALYNLDAAWKPSSPLRSWNAQFMKRVIDLQAPDDSTVQITLDRPSASFLPGLATPHVLMYPAHMTDLEAWQKAPIGTGPFKFDSFSADKSLEYVRNDNYFKKDEAGRRLPFLDGVVYHVITDVAAAYAAFRTGRTDCGCTFDTDFMTPNRVQLLKDFPDMIFFEFWSPGFLYFNGRPPFDQQKLRQAISIGIDRRLFAEALQDGFTWFPGSFFYPPEVGGQFGLTTEEMLQIPGWREDRAADLALARQLLAEIDLDPADVALELLASTHFENDALLIDAGLRELGIKPTLKLLPRGADRVDRIEGLFDISYETPGPAFDDPVNLGANWVLDGGSSNFGKWSNPVIESLFADVDLELDPVKRVVIAKELQRELIDWAIMVPMPYTGRFHGVREYVKGWTHITPLTIDVSGRLDAVWLDR